MYCLQPPDNWFSGVKLTGRLEIVQSRIGIFALY